jgi:hypothetical protein
MEYLKGYTTKPYQVLKSGVVVFTDGTNNDLSANQQTCEAYGYTYDRSTGTCKAYALKPVDKIFNNQGVIEKGRNNDIGRANKNSVIVGNSNILRGLNRNTLIVGNDHLVENEIINSSIVGGASANVQRQAEVAIGGGIPGVSDAGRSTTLTVDRQQSFIQLSGVTTDNTATNLTVQGDGSSFINVKANSILGYEIYLTRFELGGTSGTAGNYSFREIKGAVQIDSSYNMAFVVGFTRNIAKIGVNGSFSMVDSSTTDVKSITVQVTDRNNVNNLWSASVYLHEVVSTAIEF